MDNAEAVAVQKVLESGWLAEGPVTKQFEDAVAKYVGAKHAVAVCNCTVALELCLKALDIRGEVIIPSFTHLATAEAVINADCTPAFCDVGLDYYNSTLLRVECHTKAYVPVSWGGHPTIQNPIALTVEDAACSLGSEYHTFKTGELGLTCFSFHPRKLITTGEGGMVTTNDGSLAKKIRSLKNFGEGGGNYKLNDIASAIGLAQMQKIDRIIDRRVEMAEIYNELLTDAEGIRTPQKHPLAKHTYQTYAVYLEKGDRNTIIAKLAENGIETQVGAYALHLLPQFENVRRIGNLHNSELLHRNLLALPMAYTMTDEDQKLVVAELKNELC